MKTFAAVLLCAAFSTLAFAEDAPKKDPAPTKDEKKNDKKDSGEKKYTEAEVGCYRCCFKAGPDCAAACRIDGKVYVLKALDTADDKTKKLIETCSGKLASKKAKVSGKVIEEKGQHWYHVGELLMAE